MNYLLYIKAETGSDQGQAAPVVVNEIGSDNPGGATLLSDKIKLHRDVRHDIQSVGSI